MLQLPHLKETENNLQSQQGSDEHLATTNTMFKQLSPCALVLPRAGVSHQSCCHGICDFIT